MMDITEAIIDKAAMDSIGTHEVEFKGHKNSKAPFKRLHMVICL